MVEQTVVANQINTSIINCLSGSGENIRTTACYGPSEVTTASIDVRRVGEAMARISSEALGAGCDTKRVIDGRCVPLYVNPHKRVTK